MKSKFAAFRAKIKAPDTTPNKNEVKEFDAGFFKVASPVKVPTFHCEGILVTNLIYNVSQNREMILVDTCPAVCAI